MTRTMVVVSGLYRYAEQMSAAASQLGDVQATFNGSAAAANVGSDVMPSKELQKQYDEAVRGVQTQLTGLVNGLNSWAQSLRETADFYQGVDQSAASTISSAGM